MKLKKVEFNQKNNQLISIVEQEKGSLIRQYIDNDRASYPYLLRENAEITADRIRSFLKLKSIG